MSTDEKTDELSEAEQLIRARLESTWTSSSTGRAAARVMVEYDERGVELEQVRDAMVLVQCDDPEHEERDSLRAELDQARARIAELEQIEQRAREMAANERLRPDYGTAARCIIGEGVMAGADVDPAVCPRGERCADYSTTPATGRARSRKRGGRDR
jgi:uncharacterized protein YlxW (UPF0749 family)